MPELLQQISFAAYPVIFSHKSTGVVKGKPGGTLHFLLALSP